MVAELKTQAGGGRAAVVAIACPATAGQAKHTGPPHAAVAPWDALLRQCLLPVLALCSTSCGAAGLAAGFAAGHAWNSWLPAAHTQSRTPEMVHAQQNVIKM